MKLFVWAAKEAILAGDYIAAANAISDQAGLRRLSVAPAVRILNLGSATSIRVIFGKEGRTCRLTLPGLEFEDWEWSSDNVLDEILIS